VEQSVIPGQGRPADPLWFAFGLALGVLPGIYFHQRWAGAAIGLVLGGALGLIRRDKRSGYRRPADPIWFLAGVLFGLASGVALHFLGLAWPLGLGLGAVLGLFLGAVAGTIRADRRQEQERENNDLAKRYRGL
jgi:hypothetical protein